MSDVFTAFVERVHGTSAVRPVLPARFEPVGPAQDVWGASEVVAETRPSAEFQRDSAGVRPHALDAPELLRPVGSSREHHVRPADVAAIDTPATSPSHGAEPRPLAERDLAAEVLREAPMDIAAIIDAALRASAAAVGRETFRESTTSSAPDEARVVDDRPTMDAGRATDPREHDRQPSAAHGTAAPAPVGVAPTIEVRIGRIEVSAPPPLPRPAPPARPARPAAAGLSLREYLSQRGRR